MIKDLCELANKVYDLENRRRRNNLAIYGVTEKPDEDAKSLEDKATLNIFKDSLGVEINSFRAS